MNRDQGPQDTLTTRNGGNQINQGIPRPIKTTGTDWFLLVLCWAFVTLFAATVALAARLFF